MLSESEYNLVRVAFHSMEKDDSGLVPLTEMRKVFNAAEHPRVKEGDMAPSKARDTLDYQFGTCARDHDGRVTLDEFLKYHEKLADEAMDEKVKDVPAFIEHTIMALWRLGDLLLPTGIRPAFPTTQLPGALYGATLMTLVWTEKHPVTGDYFLKGIKGVVRPTFARADLPEEVQGLFAFPEELAGERVEYVPAQISVQRWLDFVWEYEEGQYCGVEGIISARVDPETLPESIRQFVVEHSVGKNRQCKYVKTSISANPMYKRSSDEYGYGVTEECRKIHNWKMLSLTGKQYGNQYHGLQGKYFSKMKGPIQCNAATGINL